MTVILPRHLAHIWRTFGANSTSQTPATAGCAECAKYPHIDIKSIWGVVFGAPIRRSIPRHSRFGAGLFCADPGEREGVPPRAKPTPRRWWNSDGPRNRRQDQQDRDDRNPSIGIAVAIAGGIAGWVAAVAAANKILEWWMGGI